MYIYIHRYIHTYTSSIYTRICASSTLMAIDPIAIKINKVSQFYQITECSTKKEALVACDMEVKYPA